MMFLKETLEEKSLKSSPALACGMRSPFARVFSALHLRGKEMGRTGFVLHPGCPGRFLAPR